MLPGFTSTSVIGILWSVCLGFNLLRFKLLDTLATKVTQLQSMRADILAIPFPWIVLHLVSDTIEE